MSDKKQDAKARGTNVVLDSGAGNTGEVIVDTVTAVAPPIIKEMAKTKGGQTVSKVVGVAKDVTDTIGSVLKGDVALKSVADAAIGLMTPSEWPLPAFHFQVLFDNPLFMAFDTSFQEVSGLESQIETEEYREGGGNHFVYHLPKGAKYSNLILKRGIANRASRIVGWCVDTFDKDFSAIDRRDLSVMLLDEHGLPVRTWRFNGTYPVRWKVDNFHSTKNEVAIEEIELCYNQSSRLL